jgi:UPF0755 protein
VNDGLELFNDVSEDDHDDRRDRRYRDDRARGGGRRSARRRKRRGLRWAIVVVLVVLIAGGAYLGYKQLTGIGAAPDYAGSGDTQVVFQVNPGDTVRAIGDDMVTAGIVRSATAFVRAGADNTKITSVQPGFYVLRQHMSGAAAVNLIVTPASRVGLLEIKSGWQLDDTTSVTHKVTAGILTHISQATCAKLNGRSTCVSVAQLRQAIASTKPADLGVPDWAVPSVTSADAKHRLEGLIMPGVYNLKPGETGAQTLKRILDQSSAQLQAAGLPSPNQQSSGFSPYQVLTLASIVERESGTAADMPKISRVFYNRLRVGMNLQSDATVDYGLDRPMVATSPTERPKSGAYNSYGNSGLPPTPVSSPSATAIEAASQPSSGPWIYFVVCHKDRSSCFATNLSQHNANVQIAIANGVF